jgi:hypothetical protein
MVRLRNYPPQNVVAARGTLFQRSFGQLFTTLKEMRGFPMTLTFLIAYLFYNDGIQTVIYAASTYGSKQLKFDQSVLIATILLIQFVAFGGACSSAGWRLATALPLHPVGLLRLDGHRRRGPCSFPRRTWRSSSRSRSPSASSWAAPRRCRGRSSAC